MLCEKGYHPKCLVIMALMLATAVAIMFFVH